MGKVVAGIEVAHSVSEARYRAIVESALDAIIVIDQNGSIREFNPAAERLFGWTCDQVLGLDIAEVVIPPNLRERHRAGLLRHITTGSTTLLDRRLELVALRKNGEVFPVELTVTRSDVSPTPCFTAFIRDLSEQHRLIAEVNHHATHDSVTGLERYIVLEKRLIEMLKSDRTFVAVMLVDLDLFHGINESIGHELGDDVLRSVGRRLQGLSTADIAVCHFASDEFVIALRGGDRASALQFAESVRELLGVAFETDGYRVLLTATIGVSTSPAHGDAALDLLRRAQMASERGKALGRDCVCPFLTRDMQAIEDRVVMGGLLRSATNAGELELYYQPQFAASDLRLTGFEALLRWNSVSLGQVSPIRFIPIAEALGLMPEIGNWVIRQACRQARAWLDAGYRNFTVAVNVSPQQLRRPGLARAVAAALTEFQLKGEMLEIELTESTVMDIQPRIRRELAKLRSLGTSLTLDDFGTGYSSLAHLKNLPLDKVKIDQTFVHGLPECPLDGSIARAIVSIGSYLGFRVVAEGVETTAQAQFLNALGCDELQGFLLGEPAPAVQAEIHFDAVDLSPA
jgi:PAS domain S-box-containing protein/diguanylate cyclase (GGDEF)-like protein